MAVPAHAKPIADISSVQLIRARLGRKGAQFSTKGEAYTAGAREGYRLAAEFIPGRPPLVDFLQPEPLGRLALDALRGLLRGLIRWGSR